MVDRAGKVVLVNTEIERLFGYARDELIGQPVDILVPMRLRGPHARHRDGFTLHSGVPQGKRRPRAVRAAQGRNRIPGRGGAQSDPHRRGPAGAGRGGRHQRAQAPGAPEGRIRLDRQPRAAHAADLDLRLARPVDRRRRRSVARPGRPAAHDRADQQPKAGPAGQRYSRHREDGGEPDRLQFPARRGAGAGRSRRSRPIAASPTATASGFGSTRRRSPARCTPIRIGWPRW